MASISNSDLRRYILNDEKLTPLEQKLSSQELKDIELALAMDNDDSLHEQLEVERLKLCSMAEQSEACLERLNDTIQSSDSLYKNYIAKMEALIPPELHEDLRRYIGFKMGSVSDAFKSLLESSKELDQLLDEMTEALCSHFSAQLQS